jgi:hypothetical protein
MSQRNTSNSFGRGGGSPSLGKSNQVRRNGPGKFRVRGGNSRFGEKQGGAAQKDNAAKIGARSDLVILTYCEKGGYFAHTCPKITIQEFVSSTPEYISKYSSIVDEVYTIETGQVPDDVTRTSMVKRFSDEKFGPNDLACLIKTIKFTEKPPVSKISTYSINIISDESSDLIKESENLKKTWISLPEIKFIRNWQETTGTRIDIYEFLRYYNELGGSFSSIEHITHVKKQQQYKLIWQYYNQQSSVVV